MAPRGNQAMDTIYVELPPWSPSDTGAGRRRPNANRPREAQATQAESEYVNISGGEDQEDGVVQLSADNPFARGSGGGRGSAARRGGAPVSRRGASPPPPRGSSGRRGYSEPEQDPEQDQDDNEGEEEDGDEGGTSRNGITILPSYNPLAKRGGGGGNRGRGQGGNSGPLRRSNTAAPRQGRDSPPPPRTTSRHYRSDQDLEEGDEDAISDFGLPAARRSNTGARSTSPTPPTRNRRSDSPPPPAHPNRSTRNRSPVQLSPSEDEDEGEQERQEEQGRGPARRITILEPEPVEPETYLDGEPTPVLSAVGPNAHLTRPTGRMVTAAQKAKMISALGGNKPASTPAGSQGPSRPNTKLTTAVQKTKMLNALGLGGTKSIPSASTDPSDISPPHEDKGKQVADGNRAGPSGIRDEPILHGSHVPLRRSETERVYVPFGEEVIRDVGRPGRRPKAPFPGYPPYYPYPYPFDTTETEYIDVTGDEHEHYHHDRHHPHDRHHHHDHDRRHFHPHHWPYYPPPWAPVNSNPYNPYNSYNPAPPSHHRAPFVGPLYTGIPPLPSLFDQARSTFYTLPVPPTTLLRDLQEPRDRQVPSENPPSPRTTPTDLQLFPKGFEYICKTPDLLAALPVLAFQECQPFYIDPVFRRLSNMVQIRFAERRGDDIINRVHVVQRNRLAFGTVMKVRPKLDVDLVLPGDYVLRRWALDPQTPDDQKPRTISKALKLDAATIPRGEIDAQDLGWVIKAVLEQLDGRQDQFIFPGGNSEAVKYLESFDTSATVDGVNRIRLMSHGDSDANPIRVNVFIKVAVEVNGQEMVVGVDQASAVSAGKYQIFKLIRRPNGPLGESPLSPIERSAIIALGWWKRGVAHGDVPAKSPPGKPKLRASHFSIALKALHALDPSDELHVPHARMRARPFSMGLVVEVMLKVVKYLRMAYTGPTAIAAAANAQLGGTNGQGKAAEYLFPLSSCGIMEALYTQVASNPGEIDTLKNSGVLDDLITLLESKLPSGAKAGTSTNPPAGQTPGSGPSTSTPTNVAVNVAGSVDQGGKVTGSAQTSVKHGGMDVTGGVQLDPAGKPIVDLKATGPTNALQATLTSNELRSSLTSTAPPAQAAGTTSVPASGPVTGGTPDPNAQGATPTGTTAQPAQPTTAPIVDGNAKVEKQAPRPA